MRSLETRKKAIRINTCPLTRLPSLEPNSEEMGDKQLEEEEKVFKASFDPTVAEVLLWKSWELGCSDVAVFYEVCQGVQFTESEPKNLQPSPLKSCPVLNSS